MRHLLIAIVAAGVVVGAVTGCSANASDEGALGGTSENLTVQDLSAFQPYKTLAGNNSYTDSLELTADSWTGGRGGKFKVTRCPTTTPTECSAQAEGAYAVRMDAATHHLVLELTPTTGPVQTLPVNQSTPVPTLQSAQNTFYGKGHQQLLTDIGADLGGTF